MDYTDFLKWINLIVIVNPLKLIIMNSLKNKNHSICEIHFPDGFLTYA